MLYNKCNVIPIIERKGLRTMKIEIGESLIESWLRHVVHCKIVETNWKASFSNWELLNQNELDNLMKKSQEYFKERYGYNLYRGTSSYKQLIQQAEIDVLGINFDNHKQKIYAIEVAFHENGLNYGGKDETVSRVIKKIIRTVMCIYGYFGYLEGTIIFTSPKINKSIDEPLNEAIKELNKFLQRCDFNFNIEVIANKSFNERILKPVLNISSTHSNSNELFIRSMQLLNLFRESDTNNLIHSVSMDEVNKNKIDEDSSSETNDDIKVGRFVQDTLYDLFDWEEIPEEEVSRMTNKEYSKEVFNLNYPLLLDATGYEKRPRRYYKKKVSTYGKEYFICSQWYESSREHYLNWLERYKDTDDFCNEFWRPGECNLDEEYYLLEEAD